MGLNENISYGDLLRLTGTLLIPLILWGVNVEKRFVQSTVKINELQNQMIEIRNETKKMSEKINKIYLSVNKIEILLKQKK